MQAINCAIVGVVGSTFTVNMDKKNLVGHLKTAIKKQIGYTGLAYQLQLFLAKQDNLWLKDDETLDELLRKGDVTSFVKICATEAISDFFGNIPMKKTIQVLVIVPKRINNSDGQEVKSNRTSVIPLVANGVALLSFLESEMIDKDKTVSSPHILEPDHLQFPLIGREMEISTAANCFKDIIEGSHTTGTRWAMPVCSGISGSGKTRILEESGRIVEEMKLNVKHVFHVTVPYSDEFDLQPVEDSMPIEASFSWRLLYRFFLDKNCAFSFADWMISQLPSNGWQLRLDVAIVAIERKLRQTTMLEQERLYIFVGIDEYQKAKNLHPLQRGPDWPLQRELVDVIGDFLCLNSSKLVVLPMFAGTDLSVISLETNTNSSYMTKHLPMTQLTLKQIFRIVKNIPDCARFLRYPQVCHNLYLLGGVPGWVVAYFLELKRTSPPGYVSLETIKKCFSTIQEMYVTPCFNFLNLRQLVRLAAFSVSGQRVREEEFFDSNLKWSRLRDSLLCLLLPVTDADGYCDVRVPPVLFECIRSRGKELSGADQSFATALMDMTQHVDKMLFSLQPWRLWQMFGACFYAVRINALLVLGHVTVTLGELLAGMIMTEETRAIIVKLAPSVLFPCVEPFDSSTRQFISRYWHQRKQVDWTSNCYIAMESDSGGGDIFFALNNAQTGNVVVFADQRKRKFGRFQPSTGLVAGYLEQLSACPDFLVKNGAHLVQAVTNCTSSLNIEDNVVPQNCFLLCQDKIEEFHGSLMPHPVCVGAISKNSVIHRPKWVAKMDKVDYMVGELALFAKKMIQLQAQGSTENNEKLVVMMHELLKETLMSRSDVERSGLAAIVAELCNNLSSTVGATANVVRKHILNNLYKDTGHMETECSHLGKRDNNDDGVDGIKKQKTS